MGLANINTLIRRESEERDWEEWTGNLPRVYPTSYPFTVDRHQEKWFRKWMDG